MTEKELYQQWLEHATEDADLQTELKGIAGDDAAISDRFYRDLEFGTGGLRGVIGAGTYRMNIYTVRRATQGLANYVKSAFEAPSVAISYDSRIKSDVFAKAAAEVLAANGIRVHIYTELMRPQCCLMQFVHRSAVPVSWLPPATTPQSTTVIRYTAVTAVR